MSSPQLAATVVDALAGMGVTDIVLAPGSRSAPLALAAERADRAGQVRLHVRIDERVAGFTALGLAKAHRRVAAVITTSGTAVANLAPAAMEARAAGVPLVLLTADRPSYLVGTGANQSTDQVGAFGPSALGVVRLASASGNPSSWAAGVQRAVVLAHGRRTRRCGPVQVNLEFERPLVGPLPPSSPLGVDVSGSVAEPRAVELDARRSVVLVGDASVQAGAEARAVAELAGAPLLAEPTSNARVGPNAIPGYREALRTLGADIERVLCWGHPTLSRPVSALLARPDIELVVVADAADWPDPGQRAAVVADRVSLARQPDDWLRAWRSAPSPARPGGFTTRHVADAVLASLTSADDCFWGASGIVRAADLSPIQPGPPRAFANRGLAGIDGTIATATGMALASGRRTTVVLGDVTAQHDLGALVRPPREPWPDLRIVVADDGGGTIFGSLEEGAPEHRDAFERVFLTPQQVDLAAVAAALGWRAVTVADERALKRALAAPADFIVARLTQ